MSFIPSGGVEEVNACANCGSVAFCFDYARGDCVCVDCGACDYGRLAVATGYFVDPATGYSVRAPSFAGVAVVTDAAEYVAEQTKTLKASTPYKRETYWSERISQWRQLEPSIEQCDWNGIKKQWQIFTGFYDEDTPKFVGARWFRESEFGTLKCSYVLRKEDCREILHTIDKQRTINGQRPYFVKKYLVSFFF